MGSQFIVLTPPTVEPITLSAFKDWANIDFPDKDALIASLITRARRYAETVTGRAWATQTIRQVYTLERPTGGELSGPIMRGPNWFAFQQQIGSNPFGASQWYFDIAMPPFDNTQSFTLETRVTAFDQWVVFPQITYPDGSVNVFVETTYEPARVFIKDPLTVNFWRFTYTAGYSTTTYPLPPDMQHTLFEMINHFFDDRDSTEFPDWIMEKLLSHRTSWTGLS